MDEASDRASLSNSPPLYQQNFCQPPEGNLLELAQDMRQVHPLVYYEDPAIQQSDIFPLVGSTEQATQLAANSSAHQWDHGLYVHMPMIIPFGDTAANQTDYLNHQQQQPDHTGQHYEQIQLQEAPPLAHQIHLTSQHHSIPLNPDASNEESLSRRDARKRGASGPYKMMHNAIERRRRSRIKNCCDVLKSLIPGLGDKMDKASVLENTVKFVSHIVNCPDFGCQCEMVSPKFD